MLASSVRSLVLAAALISGSLAWDKVACGGVGACTRSGPCQIYDSGYECGEDGALSRREVNAIVAVAAGDGQSAPNATVVDKKDFPATCDLGPQVPQPGDVLIVCIGSTNSS